MTDTDRTNPSAAGLPKTRSLLFRTALAAAAAVMLFTAVTAVCVYRNAVEDAALREDERLEDMTTALARADVAAFLPGMLTADSEKFAERIESDLPLPMMRGRHRMMTGVNTYGHHVAPEKLTRIEAGKTVLIRLLEKQGQAVKTVLDEELLAGLSTRTVDGTPHRVSVVFLPGGRYTAVAEPLAVREAAVRETALTAVMPLLVLLFLLPAVILVVLRQMMKPLRRTAAEAATRDPNDLKPLSTFGVPAEVVPLVEAVNDLLARVDRARTREIRFTADAAHELRSPLTALTLEAERLARMDLAPDARRAVEGLEAGLARSVHQVSQLLHFARAQAGEASAVGRDTKPWYAAELAAELIEPLLAQMDAHRIQFEADGLDDDRAIEGLPRAAVQAVLRNLLENAVRYSPDGGTVTLTAEHRPDTLTFTVTDCGPGIPPDERERVFDPFYRMAGTGKTGTGLGLAIVRTYAEMTGAVVTLEDAKPGDSAPGLKVSVAFPLPKGRKGRQA